jgi:sporulation protein YlmC with PRC-barrel domain
MATNKFENSRVSEGTLQTGAQHDGNALKESRAISRDDVRDGFAEPPVSKEGNSTAMEVSDMIAEGGPVPTDRNIATASRLRMPGVVAASTLVGHPVLKSGGEQLGNIEEIMLDLKSGRIAYAVLSFTGFPAIGNKRFPVPWNTLQIHLGEREFVLDVDVKTLEGAPNFDKDNWPDMADPAFERVVHKHYGTAPYWEHTVAGAGGYQAQTRH